MSNVLRGADVVVQALKQAGVEILFTLSGNQIMSVFDACFDACLDKSLRLIHVRHEAAAVHAADAWGRLTGRPGAALVTAGPGLANCLSALYVAKMAESPLVLLSGRAPYDPLDQGTFQDMPQAEMALPVCKASWTVSDASHLGDDLRKAFTIASSGRPGPVHVSLPVNILESTRVQNTNGEPLICKNQSSPSDHSPVAKIRPVVEALAHAVRPLVLAGPYMMCGEGQRLLDEFSQATQIPAVGMDSPRGVNDPRLGAIAEVLPEADVVLLLGKRLDFTLRLGGELVLDPACRLLQLDADEAVLELSQRTAPQPSRVWTAIADPRTSLATITQAVSAQQRRESEWHSQVQAAVTYRPPAWGDIDTGSIDTGSIGPPHPVEICRGVQQFLDEAPAAVESIFISDGGEFGQWVQACLTAKHRLINGPSGGIGGIVPFALAARLAFPQARIIACTGDGALGFHGIEFDTAVRYHLPFITLVGNDAAWNAEYQIQLRKYGRERAIGCELLPTRYDQMAQALGGFGQHLSTADEIPEALRRAEASRLPACLNINMEGVAAPVIRRDP